MSSQSHRFDVVIVGAGVTGASLLYLLAKYSNVGSIAVIEKESSVAEISSHAAHNSQTLHFGDIETNYSFEKARTVKAAAEMIVRYAAGLSDGTSIVAPMQKMVICVGEKEVATLTARYREFKDLFPDSRLVGREELSKLEPKVVEGRDPKTPIAAMFNPRGFAVDFGRLAESFVARAKEVKPQGLAFFFETRVRGIVRGADGFEIDLGAKKIAAGAVVVAAGAYSLRMAHALGYGRDLTLLPVAGDFFTAPNVLRGKVYTMQEKLLPFAAVHGDPDITDRNLMRFGPLALATPLLEPKRWRTIFDFFKVFKPNSYTIATVIKVNTEPIVLRFILRHMLYYLPFVGKRFFMREARKIVPTLRASDVHFGKNMGGVRPQVANIRTRTLQLGEAKLVADGLIFNITPSPGASVCLQNAEADLRTLISHFNGRYALDEAALVKDLGGGAS